MILFDLIIFHIYTLIYVSQEWDKLRTCQWNPGYEHDRVYSSIGTPRARKFQCIF